jgi:hypothetical protein
VLINGTGADAASRIATADAFDLLEVYSGSLADDSQGRLSGDVTGEVQPIQQGNLSIMRD